MHWLSVMHLAGLVRSNVDRQLSPKGRSGETGAVAMLVAILLGTGVLLGLGAIVIDTGSLLYERRQLQNGADAAALSVAKTCALADQAGGLCAAPGSSDPTLVGLAGANAADQKSDIASVCGSPALVAVNSAFAPCPSPASPGLVECTKTSSAAKFVEVKTSSRSGDGSSTILPPFLAQTLAGGSYSGETVKACARAGWGPGYPNVVAVTDALCAWTDATNNTPPFPVQQPPYTSGGNVPVDAKYVAKILLQGSGGSGNPDPGACGKIGPSGAYVPGNFGWLNPKAGQQCEADINGDTGVVSGSTGAAPPKSPSPIDCGAYLTAHAGQIIYIPIFTATSGTGSGATFTIDGVAAFLLAGGRAPGMPSFNAFNPVDLNGVATPHCVASDNDCLWGWFLSPLAPYGKMGTGKSRGPIIITVLG